MRRSERAGGLVAAFGAKEKEILEKREEKKSHSLHVEDVLGDLPPRTAPVKSRQQNPL